MALTLTIKDHWEDTKRVIVVGTIVPTGNYATGGDTIDFGLPLIKSNSAPIFVIFNNLSKYLLKFVFGTTINNGKIKVIVPDTGLELAQAGYPNPGLTADVITFMAFFHKHK